MTVNQSGPPWSGAVYGARTDRRAGREKEEAEEEGRREELENTMTGHQPASPAHLLQGLEAVLLLQGLSSVLCQIPDPEVRA